MNITKTVENHKWKQLYLLTDSTRCMSKTPSCKSLINDVINGRLFQLLHNFDDDDAAAGIFDDCSVDDNWFCC